MNNITEIKPVTTEIKTFLPVKGIKFVANFLQHEVRAFSDYFSKRISTTFGAKPAIANVFKKTLFTEPELVTPPEVISEEAQRVAIYKDSLFRTVDRSATKPITAEMIAFLAEDLQEVDAALLTQDSAIIEGQKRAEQLKKIIKSGSDDELAAFSQSLVGKSFSMPFTIRKESLAGVAALENVVDKVEKTVNNIDTQFEQLKAVDESIEQRINALKEWGRKYFPESWCDAIEKSFMLDARDIFIDNCPVESAGALWDRLVQHGIHDTVEQSIKGALDEKLATIQKTATCELDKVTSMIPLEAQSLLSHAGYDLNHSTGWLEVVKQPDNRFTVTIYAKTSLLDLPGPTPLVFTNVPAENLNQELFYRLFSYDAWPQWKKAKGFSWQDFTKGFLDQLQVAPNLPKDEDQPTRNCFQNHPLFLALIATKASTDPENYILRLQRQALIDGWAQKSPGLLPLAKSLYSNAKKCLKGVELRKIEAAYLELSMEPQKTQEAFSIPALPALREVAVEFFGQEMGETIDSVTTTKAPESVGVIDQFVTHIKQFRPSLYHLFRLCSDAVRIAYHPILGTLLGLTAHLALTLIVPGYALLGPALYLVVSKMVAQFGIDILYSILPKEMRQYLVKVSSFVREIRDHIFKRIKFAALKILLHFFIDPKVALKLTNLQQSITKNGEISFELPGNSVKPLTFTPLRITSVTPLPRVQKNAHLSNDMKEWLKIFTQDVLFAHIATLPIPKRGVPNPFWDTFTDTETLHKLILASASGVEPTAQKMMSFYTLYAIADYLARRDPNSHLSDAFKSNPTELMKWTSSLAAQVPDAQGYARLKELADYFEFDLTKRYTEDECIARSEASLFHVNPQKFTLGTAIRDVTLQSSWLASNYSTMTQVFNHKNSIDYCFYKELLKDPEIAKRIDQSKGEFEQVVQLYMDPQTQEHTDGILPQSFRTLRLIDTIAYNAHTVCRDKVSDIRFHLNKIDSLLTIPFHAKLDAAGHTPLKNETSSNPAEALCHSINPNAFYKKLRSAACVREPGSSSQMATVIAVREDTTEHLFKKALTTQGKINVEMITAHKADMVVRALAFFSQSPELLEEGPFQTFFSHCLLNVGALQTQLKARPSFSTHIASCFLHFFSLPTSYETHIFLLKLALQLDALHDGIIPDLKKYLRNELETTKDRRYASQLADMLKGSTFLFDPSEEIVTLTKGMVPRGCIGIDRGEEIYYPATSVRSIKATGAIFYERDGKRFELVSSDALSQEFQKRACWKNGSTLLVTEDTYVYKTIKLEELQETAVDLKTAAHGLNLLSWLHPVSKMKAYCLRDQPETLSRLDMPKLDLSFRLENNEMVSVGKFHNYFIKRTQKHPALKDIPQYLLLENPKGEQLVLIPKQSEFALIGTYLAKHFAGLMVPHLITKIASQNENSYYVYTLKDELETLDPAAVANCLITAIVKEDAAACKKWLLKLADLGRIYPFTDALFHQLNLAMVPLLVTSDPEWLAVGLKLAAITRSNGLLLAHRSEPFTLAPVFASLPEKNRALYWTMLQMAFRRYLGHLAEGAKPTLDPQEELMLLQEIGEISAHFIKSQFPLNSKVADKILDPQLMLEQLAMSPEIVHRYQKIKTVLGEKISLREAFNYFLYLSIHAPPLERPKADPGLLATLSNAADTLQDTLNQATGLVSEWLKFKSVNPIDQEFIAKVARVGLTHLAHKKSEDHRQFLELDLDITVLKKCPTLQEQLESCPITIRSTFEQDFTKYAASYFCLAAGRGPALRSKEFRKNLLALSGNFSPEIQRLILFLQGIALSNKPIEFSKLEEFWNGPDDLEALQKKIGRTRQEDALLNKAASLGYTLKKQATEALKPKYLTPELRNHAKQKFEQWREQGITRVVTDTVTYGSYIYNPISILSYTRWAYNLLWLTRKVVNTSHAISLIREKERAPSLIEGTLADSLKKAMSKREADLDRLFKPILDEFFDVTTREPPAPITVRQYAASRLNQTLTEYQSRKAEPNRFVRLKTGKTEAELNKALQPLLAQYKAYEEKVIREVERFCPKHTFHEIESLFIQGKAPKELAEKLLLYQITRSRVAPLLEGKNIGPLLARKRVYSFDEPQSEKWLKAKLAFESRSGNFLWKKPMEQLKAMLQNGNEKLVLELIMASGKTYYGIPTTDYMLADQKHLVVNIWPQSLAPTNIKNTSVQSRLMFDQSTNAARFERHQGWKLPSVRALYGNLQAVRRNQGHYNMTEVDAQGLELKFLELCLNKPDLKVVDYLKECLKIIRKTGVAIPDEAHEAFFCRKELNYPLGRAKFLDDDATDLINQVMLEIVSLIRRDVWHKIPPETFHSEIMPRIAQAIAPKLAPENQTECIDYVCGKLDRIPDFVQNSPYKKQLGLLKGMLEKILPHVLSKIIDVDFCNSDEAFEEFAKPSSANMTPQKRSVIQNPFEAYVKTCMLTLRKRITKERMGRYLGQLQHNAKAEKTRTGVRINQTKSGKLFASLGFNLESVNENTFEKIVGEMVLSDKATLAYTKAIINPKIRYFPSKLSSNAQNFASMFSAFYGDTGSPYNDGSFPVGTEVLWDKGTLGETLELLQRKCSEPDSVEVLEKENPRDVLDEMLERYKHAHAICDRGALFRGLTNIEVAKRILEKTPYQGVVFYHNNQEVILEKGSEKPIALHESSLAKEERFTYFDQYHTFGANVPQCDDALCIVTFGEDITLALFCQALWRMRGLKTANQSLKIVTTKAVTKAMSCPKPTIDDVIAFAEANETHALREDNFHADKHKLHNYVRRMLLDEILEADSIEKSIALILKYKNIFVHSLEDDPFALYGMIDKEIPANEALENYKKELLAKFPALQDTFDAFPLGNYPERVKTANSDLGLALELDEDQEQAIELHQNLQVDQAQDVNVEYPTIVEPPFWPWPKDIGGEWPPIYQLQNILKEAESEELQKLAPHFSPEIVTTTNFTPRGIAPFGPFQKPIFEILIMIQDGQRKLLLLDQKEANYWRKRITDGYALYDIALGAVVAGNIDEATLHNDVLFHRSIAMLKFLNGDVQYSDKQATILSRWIQKCGRDLVKQAFLQIHEDHQISPLDGTVLDSLFIK